MAGRTSPHPVHWALVFEGDAVRKTLLACLLPAGFAALAGVAHAQPTLYTWTGYGEFGLKSTGNKCGSYRMTVDVAVDGAAVRGTFQQALREQRHFEATLDAAGAFKTTAVVDSGDLMDVTGTIRDGGGAVTLDGYCRFKAKLVRK